MFGGGLEITGAIMITHLLLGRDMVHQNFTHNCTFIYIHFYIYMVTKYDGIFLGGRCNNYYESSPVGETVHHIITHNCNNDYESSPGGGDGSSNHHT